MGIPNMHDTVCGRRFLRFTDEDDNPYEGDAQVGEHDEVPELCRAGREKRVLPMY